MSGNKRSRSDDETVGDPSEQDELEASNIAHVRPHEGMRLEIRDADYIWSSGFIVQVSTKDDLTMVTVASDGWGSEWNEVIQWPNDRLAKLYTYTKQVKCNLDLLRKFRSRKPSRQEMEKLPKHAKKVYSTVWPSTVQFRMPHPGVKHAMYALRLENKVFVKPYGMEFLPTEFRKMMVHDGGCWLHHSKLRLWKDDPISFGILPAKYERAFEIALKDTTVKGLLRVNALEDNSLLQEVYRSRDIRGCDTFDGVLRETQPPQKRQRLQILDDEEEGNETGSEKPPSVVAIRSVVDPKVRNCFSLPHFCTRISNCDHAQPEFFEPPKLPPPIPITGPLYPQSGVSKCKKTNRWVASLSMNGNQVFLGSFPTESQAWLAIRKSKGEANVEVPQTLLEAQHADIQGVSMETIIDAYEAHYDPAIHTFSLHNWTVAKINHYCYMREKLRSEVEARQKKPEQGSVQPQPRVERKSKRKGRPRKLASSQT